MKCELLPLRIVAGLVLLVAPAQAQTTWYVDIEATPPGLGTQAEPYASLQYAIAQATTVDGDTVLVAPGDYVGNLGWSKEISVRSSEGPLVTTIRASQSGWVVLMNDDSTLEGFTVTGTTSAGLGGGIFVQIGRCNIRRCIVRDNAGEGIRSFYDAFVSNCTVTGNATGMHTVSFGGTITADSSIVTHNVVDLMQDGGSILDVHHSVVGAPDPGFWNYDERDLRLRPGSIAIDAGSPFAAPDPDGSVTDAGALIYDPTYAPGPSVYCTGKLNSQGCVPAIGAIGSASASSAAPFVITASQELPGVPGLLFFGFAPRAAPFQGAWHCVEPPTPRVGGQISTGSGPCGGSFAFDMNAYIQSGVYPSLVPGEIVYSQWWSRDLQDPAGFGTGLTNALYFGIAP